MPHILIATDADYVLREVASALSGPDTTIAAVRNGKHVVPAVLQKEPDLVVLDMQIGNMGAMAVCMDLRLEAGALRVPDIDVIMLLDRKADLFLAQRSEADGWLLKPLDALRLRKAAQMVMGGGVWYEGLPTPPGEAPGDAESTTVDEVASDESDETAGQPAPSAM